MKIIKISLFCTFLALSFIKCKQSDDVSITQARQIIETAFVNPVAIPNVVDATNGSFEAKSDSAIINGNTINTLTYGGASILGPTLKIEKGALLNLLFANKLAEATNIHCHNLEHEDAGMILNCEIQ